MVQYGHSLTMKRVGKDVRRLQDQLKSARDSDEKEDLLAKLKEARKQLAIASMLHMKYYLVTGLYSKKKSQYTGQELREYLATNPKRAHIIICEAFGESGILALSDEAVDGLFTYNDTYNKSGNDRKRKRASDSLPPIGTGWQAAHLTNNLVKQLEIGFKYDLSSKTEKPVFLARLPTADNPDCAIPVVGLIGFQDEFIHLPLMSQLMHNFVVGLACRPQERECDSVKACFLRTEQGIEKSHWFDAFFYSGFSERSNRNLFSVIVNLLGTTPIDFGGVAQIDSNRPLPRATPISLDNGDIAIISERTWFRAGRPASFPTTENFRIQFTFGEYPKVSAEEEKDVVSALLNLN